MVTFRLEDGRGIHFRDVRPEDQPLIAEAIRTASRETLLHRFFTPLRELAPDDLRRLLTLDPAKGACIVGELDTPRGKRLVAGARYVRLQDAAAAEIALTVHDEFQGRGIGTFMLRTLIDRAQADGIHTFVADILATNQRMLRLIEKLAPARRSTLSEGVCHVEFPLAGGAPRVPRHA